MNKHHLNGKHVIVRSRSPLLGRRLALVVDWWHNVASKIQNKDCWLAYEYRQFYYNLPRDNQQVYVDIDNANFIVHNTELDTEAIYSFPQGVSWQDASVAVLTSCLDIITRRCGGEPDDALAADYQGTDYELHPAVTTSTAYLHMLHRHLTDRTIALSKAGTHITHSAIERERWLEAIKSVLALTKEGMKHNIRISGHMAILQKITELPTPISDLPDSQQ